MWINPAEEEKDEVDCKKDQKGKHGENEFEPWQRVSSPKRATVWYFVLKRDIEYFILKSASSITNLAQNI